MGWKHLFAKKDLETLLAEMAGEHRLHRALGPVSLTTIGVGCIIGAGIFVVTGKAAALDAGPAVIVSYLVCAVSCVLAALCYAEFAAMAPVAGSAYTYAYTTLGEIFAWMIGWDLILEYAMALCHRGLGLVELLERVLAGHQQRVPADSQATPLRPVHAGGRAGRPPLAQPAVGLHHAGDHGDSDPGDSRERTDQRRVGGYQSERGAAGDRRGLRLHPAGELDLDPVRRALAARKSSPCTIWPENICWIRNPATNPQRNK